MLFQDEDQKVSGGEEGEENDDSDYNAGGSSSKKKKRGKKRKAKDSKKGGKKKKKKRNDSDISEPEPAEESPSEEAAVKKSSRKSRGRKSEPVEPEPEVLRLVVAIIYENSNNFSTVLSLRWHEVVIWCIVWWLHMTVHRWRCHLTLVTPTVVGTIPWGWWGWRTPISIIWSWKAVALRTPGVPCWRGCS